jgi:DNA-binding MarR family transcriptional regulator
MSQHGARLVLSALVLENGSSQRRLAEITHLSPPTVSVILRNMQDEGIVELSPDDDDKRQMKVMLTDYGREVDRLAIEKIKQTDALALNGLSEQECALLMGLLNKMRENLLSEHKCASKEKKQ